MTPDTSGPRTKSDLTREALLPTPTAMDSAGSRSTAPPSTDGRQPWDVPLPLPWSDTEDDPDSLPDSLSG